MLSRNIDAFQKHELILNEKKPLRKPDLKTKQTVYITLKDVLPVIKSNFDDAEHYPLNDYEQINYSLRYSPRARVRFDHNAKIMDTEGFHVAVEMKHPRVRFGGVVECQSQDDRLIFIQKEKLLIRVEAVEILSGTRDNETDIKVHRLLKADSNDMFDLELFNSGHYQEIARRKTDVDVLTEFLFQDVLDEELELRLMQSYFLASAAIQDCIGQLSEAGFNTWEKLADKVEFFYDAETILVIPELIRILIDEKELSWEIAYDTACRACRYKYHENPKFPVWPIDIFEKNLPRVYQIIHEAHKNFVNYINNHPSLKEQKCWIQLFAPLYDNQVRAEQLQYLLTVA